MTHDQAYALLPELIEVRLADAAEPELRAHVEACDVCTARLSDLQRAERALRTARSARADSLSSLEARVLGIPAGDPRRPAGRVLRRLLSAGVAVAAAASIAALVIALSGPGVTPAPAGFESEQTVALRPVDGNAAGTVEFGRTSGSTRVVRLKVHGLPVTGTGAFDLWLIGESGAIRAGSFGPDPDGACVVDLTAPAQEEWDRLAITPAGSGPNERIVAVS